MARGLGEMRRGVALTCCLLSGMHAARTLDGREVVVRSLRYGSSYARRLFRLATRTLTGCALECRRDGSHTRSPWIGSPEDLLGREGQVGCYEPTSLCGAGVDQDQSRPKVGAYVMLPSRHDSADHRYVPQCSSVRLRNSPGGKAAGRACEGLGWW